MTRSRYERVLSQIEARRVVNSEEALASLLEPSQVALLDPDEASGGCYVGQAEPQPLSTEADAAAAEAQEDPDRPLAQESTEALIKLLSPDEEAEMAAPVPPRAPAQPQEEGPP